MKKNKKGFSLIELLAVIIILAVIALIAVPVVKSIMNKANKNAFKDTAYGIISAGELYFSEQDLEGMSGEATFDLSEDVNTEGGLQIKGKVPKGTLKINAEGEIALAINNERYCITKRFSEGDVTITEDISDCDIPEEIPEGSKTLAEVVPADNGGISSDGSSTGEGARPSCVTDKTKCPVGTALAIQVNAEKTYKFRVLNDNGKKVTLIMAESLGDEVKWNDEEYCETYEGDEGEETWCEYYTTFGPKYALRELKTRTSDWTNIDEYSYTLDYGTGTYSGDFVQNVRARMPKLSDFTTKEIGCEIEVEGICPGWLTVDMLPEEEGDVAFWLSDAHENFD